MADVVHLADYRPVPLSVRPELSGGVSIALGPDEHEEHITLRQARRFLCELEEAIDVAEHLARVAREERR